MLRRLIGTGGSGSRRGRSRTRLGGCLLWILGLIIVLVVLSLLFGGFQKGTKVNGAGPAVPFTAGAACWSALQGEAGAPA